MRSVSRQCMWAGTGQIRDRFDPHNELNEAAMDNLSALLDRITSHAEPLIFSALILAAGFLLAALADNGLRRVLREAKRHNLRISMEAGLVLSRAVRTLVLTFTVILMLSFWGFGLSGMWTGMLGLIAGIGVALVATWAIVSNITGALLLSIWRPYHIGDTFEILPEAVKGRAIDRNLMFTVLRQDDGWIVSIPNNLIFQRVVRSYPAPHDWMPWEDTPVPVPVPQPSTQDGAATHEENSQARRQAEETAATSARE
jgi:small-conductance mechanosensitive channel